MYGKMCGMQSESGSMRSPVNVQFCDGTNDIRVIGAINQSDFDGHIVKLSFRPIVQPSLLFRVGTEVFISIMNACFGTVKLSVSILPRVKHTKETAWNPRAS
jgi:hypothetical protein